VDEEDGACDGGEGEGAGGAVEGLVLGSFGEVSDGEDGGIVVVGEAGEGREVAADLGGGVVVDAVHEGGDGVEDDEFGPGLGEAGFEEFEVFAEGEGFVLGGAGVEGAEGEDEVGVSGLCEDSGEDGVLEAVFGGEEEGGVTSFKFRVSSFQWGGCRPRDYDPWSWLLGGVGHGEVCGESGGEVEGDEGFSEAGVSGEEGDFSEGDEVLPEPGGLGGGGSVDGGGHGSPLL
jgi:hypothetical protein